MITLKKRAQAYFRDKYPSSVLYECDFLQPPDGLTVHSIVAFNFDTGVMHPLLAVPQLGGNAANELEYMMYLRPRQIAEARSNIMIETQAPKRQKRRSADLVDGPVLTLYTDQLAIDAGSLINKFDEVGMAVDVVSEDELHQSAFISYGGPDEKVVAEMNSFLTRNGVKTWFFPVDKLPGQKLHRMMYNGVNTHDRILLVCSKSSLSRPGVMNEIERVLEREAREGGSDILIPLSIDDFLFSDQFVSTRPDIVDQIKSRVAATVPNPKSNRDGFEQEMSRVVAALRRGGA
ncbi:toll/interleukin-1 receptor domain-containing protein [Trinickia acidisoli]|uniref:toll/interleukin-1 receptor domain-containing protein n=1 Tax=Trinickia acidisoli TaxID=2767482 RepID=UPI001A9098E3|nr:toll/interleukin-1 receptor domain-containing protein [Trinickia acidisoli]